MLRPSTPHRDRMSRQTITAAQLHAMLVREFMQARVVDCVTRCRMPEPIYREARTPGEPNWHVRPPIECPRHCHRVIAAVVTALGARYDIESPSSVAA